MSTEPISDERLAKLIQHWEEGNRISKAYGAVLSALLELQRRRKEEAERPKEWRAVGVTGVMIDRKEAESWAELAKDKTGGVQWRYKAVAASEWFDAKPKARLERKD